MSQSRSPGGKELYEFGRFRVDAQRQILLRDGEPVPLTPKAFQLLLVLVRSSDRIVPKDELMNAVWPDTFVEETNLTRNIFVLRRALGESGQDRYIITVPGTGYRLASHVRLLPECEFSVVAASHSKMQVQVRQAMPWVWIGAAVVVTLGIGVGTVRFLLHRAPILTEKDTVVLADFANSTGDPVFDETLRQGMAVQLAQSPYLSLISDERIQQTLKMMGRPPDARLTPEVARELCERTGSAVILEGSIASLGSQYVLGLRAKNCRNGDVLDEAQAQAARKEDVLNVLSQIASKFRTRVGESLATVAKHNTPLAEATTPSLEALRAYSLGCKEVFSPAGPADAVPSFGRAVEIDPQFASAYAMLGRVYADLGESALSAENTCTAYRLRDRASDRERFFITSSYDLQVTGNLEKARQTAELWRQTYPRDQNPCGLLSWIYQELGKFDESAGAGREAILLDRDSVPGYANLAWAYVFLDRLGEAEGTVQLASDRKLEFPDLYLLRHDLAFLKNDPTGMQRAVALAGGKSGAEHWLAQRQACVLAYSGRVREARAMSRRAVQLANQCDQRERAANYLAGVATREALFGNAAEAGSAAISGLQISRSRDVEYGAAFALAMSGDRSRTLPLVDDLKKRFPEDTFVRFVYIPTLHAILAQSHGESSQAIELLQTAGQYDLAVPGTWFGFFGTLYPAYVRGQAFLSMRRDHEAAAEFQKILDHKGLVASDPIGALARLQLGRAYSLSGNTTKARSAYRDFLMLWEDADPDVPILKQARAEYARLQ
jgi:DNA-binding winged helix-turn-helix (wHTH) protein/tetratricopeptide (TPR) repeat protein